MHTALVKHQKWVDSHRTHTLTMPYKDLVNLIGEPHFGTDHEKSDADWRFHFRGVPKALIFLWNYKNGPTYGETKTIEEVDEWSVFIGGEKAQLAETGAKGVFGNALTDGAISPRLKEKLGIL
ncbi:MAG: hypothetical protein CMB80_01090 [Flammeovirgaceae bacterium]|nr:hypothetical protein [Flammeovirgaceae bacterium]|tara:strand:+ start:2942 stop:3310 length:369 start_codon:yes stop_codon:yes gene_type:complete